MNAIEAVVHVVEDEIKRLEAESERVLEEDGPECELLQDIYARLDAMDPSTFESRAAALLTGLGFEPTMMNKATKDLSGGWSGDTHHTHTHTGTLACGMPMGQCAR